MAGLVPAIHAFLLKTVGRAKMRSIVPAHMSAGTLRFARPTLATFAAGRKTWMPATGAGMTGVFGRSALNAPA